VTKPSKGPQGALSHRHIAASPRQRFERKTPPPPRDAGFRPVMYYGMKLRQEKKKFMEMQNQQYYEDLLKYEEEVVNCRSQTSKLEGENQDLKLQNSDKNREIEELRNQLTASDQEIERLHQRLHEQEEDRARQQIVFDRAKDATKISNSGHICWKTYIERMEKLWRSVV
jgi:predicted RNase H-like nuclease (RuvC/YqgF family)